MSGRKVTASTLKQKSIVSSTIKRSVGDIIKAFEQDATVACENHLGSCDIKIPTVFDVPGMTNKKAQLLIYTELVKELEDREFHVQIDRGSGIWTISGWEIKVDSNLEKQLVELIASRTVRPKMVQPKKTREVPYKAKAALKNELKYLDQDSDGER